MKPHKLEYDLKARYRIHYKTPDKQHGLFITNAFDI